MDLLDAIAPWIADGIVIFALFFMTVGVYGLATMPDVYLKMHAASKAVVLGTVGLMIASLMTRDTPVITRAILIIVAILLTSPISSHAIANAAVRRKDRMRTADSINESPYELDKPDTAHVGDSGDARLRTLLGE